MAAQGRQAPAQIAMLLNPANSASAFMSLRYCWLADFATPAPMAAATRGDVLGYPFERRLESGG
jgi:hypothetical protein